MKLLFATGNAAKVSRFYNQLLKNNIEIVSLKEMNLNIEVEENGKNAIENALIKARAYRAKANMPVMAMDDNLYIDEIPDELQPGMFVRRVNGKRLSDEEMIEYYSNLAKKYGNNGRLTARWVYGLAIIINGKEKTYTWNKEDFYISSQKSNKIKPGYPLNTISINKKLNKFFIDMTEDEKAKCDDNDQDVIDFIVKTIKSGNK